jgi:hypothetical protein
MIATATTARTGGTSFLGLNLTVISREVRGVLSGTMRSVVGRPF